jgi:type IV secretory pathway TraG/TraD family ATPase VirD4
MILPDFASIGALPDFLSKFLTMQHYRISCILLLRSAMELKQTYHDDADLILDTGCMACVYSGVSSEEDEKAGVPVPLGSTSISNPEYIANRAGYDRMPSGEKRPVLTADQVRTLGQGQVLCLIGGFDAFVDNEYALEA